MGDVVPIKNKWDNVLKQASGNFRGSRVLSEWNATQAPSVLKAAQGGQAKPTHSRKFQAARIDRTTASWTATTNSINQELKKRFKHVARTGTRAYQKQ
jgi:hypothetical protein